ncbi:MAG: UDP-N-acetylmuramoyl-L-alanyl-D-glutamate--2,6-diaminopimelate ligase [Halofilum sp. (in: g-proteobacteria)]
MAAEVLRGVPLTTLLPPGAASAADDRAVTSVALDSRAVGPGAAFVALPGQAAHGLDYLDEALRGGAAVVLHDWADPRWTADADARCEAAGALAMPVRDLARQLGGIASRFYNEPTRAFDRVIAVTGTDGKTSVSHYIAAMLDEPEAPAAVVGTLGHGRVGQTEKARLTTPDAIALQTTFAELASAGVRRVALEASSHGLDQYRLDGTRIDVAVLTQLGRDHLDYHGDEATYAAAKARLFDWPGLGVAVLNTADAFGQRLARALPASVRRVTYGAAGADLTLGALRCEATGLSFELRAGGGAHAVRVPLFGPFNADNLLAAAGALLAVGLAPSEIAHRMQRVGPVPGRMELFHAPGRAGVVVDYAHNAGALTAALAALRPHATGRLWCIFGAGGDRDRGKRPLMGAAAAAGADHVIVTDDNPRSEDPAAIVREILAGMPAPEAVEVEHDRGHALRRALTLAAPDDLILLAGKGHETMQLRGDEILHFSDRDAARAALGFGGGAA